MTFIKKNRLLVVAVIIELLLLAFAAWDFFLPRFYLHMEGDSIPFNGGYYDNGCYVDETCGNPGFFTYGPNITLPRGVFSVKVSYSADTDKNTVSCMGGNTTLTTLKYDNVTLSPANDSVTFTLWSNKQVKDFQITTIYGGTGSLNVKSIEIAETYAGSTLIAFYVLLFGMIINLMIVAISYYRTHNVSNESIRTGLALGGLIIFSTYPMFTDFLTEGHDLLFHLLRIEGISEGLLDGQFPVKIQPTQLNGYGYAASVFYGDIFLYIPAILRIVGFSVQGSYMWFVFLVNAATVLLCYYSFHGIFGERNVALLGTILYSLSPYRLINIYGRAAVGEYTAMIFLPLLAFGLYRIFTMDVKDSDFKRTWLIPVIAYSGIIQSHILSTELVGIFTIIICLLLVRKVFVKERFIVLVKIVIITVFANLGFLVPLADYMLQKVCIISEGSMTTPAIQQNALYIARLFTIFPGADSMPYSRKANYNLGMQDEMGITVGIALIIAFLLFLYFMIIQTKKQSHHYKLGKFSWLIGCFTLILSVNIFPWDFLNDLFGDLVGNIQFPWRFLGIGSVALSIVACCTLLFIRENYEKPVLLCYNAIIIFTAILVSGFLLGDLLDKEIPYRVYSANALRTDTSGTYFNEYAPIDTDFESLDGTIVSSASSDVLQITNYHKKYTTVTATISNTSENAQYVELPLLYYPGYQVEAYTTTAHTDNTHTTDAHTDDWQKSPLVCGSGDNNLIRLIIPDGFSGNITVEFKQPVIWIVSEWIAVITWGIIIITLCLVIKRFYSQNVRIK